MKKLENGLAGTIGVAVTATAMVSDACAADTPIEVAWRRATALEIRGWGPGSGLMGSGSIYALGQVVETPRFFRVSSRPDGLTADAFAFVSTGGVASMPGGGPESFQITTTESADAVVVGSSNEAAAQSLEEGLSTVAIACGEFHTLLLKRDGTVTARGWNGLGQTTVPEGLTNVVSVGCGLDHSLAVLADGRAVLWGRNDVRQSELEESENHGFVAGAGGLLHTILLRGDGTIHVTHPQFRPPGGNVISNAVAVAAGAAHSVVLHHDGRVSVFGRVAAPVLAVPAAAQGAVSVAAGGFFSLALKPDGRVVAWGDDTYGQIRVPDAATNVVAIAAGSYHGVALRRDGRVVAWGEGSNGALAVPLDLKDGLAVAAGGYHTQVLVRSGGGLEAPHREGALLASDLFMAAGTRYTVERSENLSRWDAGPVLRAQSGQFSVPFQELPEREFIRVREWVGARGAIER